MSVMYLLLCRPIWRFLRDVVRVGELVCLRARQRLCFRTEMMRRGGEASRGAVRGVGSLLQEHNSDILLAFQLQL